ISIVVRSKILRIIHNHDHFTRLTRLTSYTNINRMLSRGYIQKDVRFLPWSLIKPVLKRIIIIVSGIGDDFNRISTPKTVRYLNLVNRDARCLINQSIPRGGTTVRPGNNYTV